MDIPFGSRFSVFFLPLVAVTVGIAVQVNSMVPAPYMDEIFHIPQTQQYCAGDLLTWDPMITTFPGLYFLALTFVRLLHLLASLLSPSLSLLPPSLLSPSLSLPDCCSTPVLRSLNALLLLLSFPLFLSTSMAVQRARRRSQRVPDAVPTEPCVDEADCFLRAAIFVLFPLHFFFGFLFYTDVASSVAVLLLLKCCYEQWLWGAGLAAAAAVFIRQTNAVWVVFATAVAAMHLFHVGIKPPSTILLKPLHSNPPQQGTDYALASTDSSHTTAEKAETTVVSQPGGSELYTPSFLQSPEVAEGSSVVLSLLLLLLRVWQRLGMFLRRFLPLISVVGAFVVFVFLNRGIVVGDRSQHRMSLHFMQPLYCAATIFISLLPIFIHNLVTRPTPLASVSKHPLSTATWAALLSGGIYLAIRNYSLAHPYLLADNRHFTFYIWRRLIHPPSFPSLRFAHLPVYSTALVALHRALSSTTSNLWMFLFFVCTCLVLVPAPLLEFRYFLIPYMVALLHIQLPRKHRLWLAIVILLGYILVNAVTMGLFFYRPFMWANHNGWQRFMW